MPQALRAAPWRVLIAACLLSGCAALAYQILWTRQIALVMGNTVAAVTTVVATFMAGLGLGSALAARFADRLPRARLPRAYAALEWGIAASALALPYLLRGATPALADLYRAGESSAVLLGAARFASSASLLLVPTTLMGATLPVLVALASPPAERIGGASGLLYAANTLGAVGGSLAGALLLLPLLGTAGTQLVAVALNAAAGGMVLALAGKPETASSDAQPAERKKGRDGRKRRPLAPLETLPARVVLAAIALSGLGALAHEVAWTRALILLIGPTSYAFSFILTAVILGIALGSALASPLADRLRRPGLALAGVEIGIALSSVAVIVAIGRLAVPAGELARAHADQFGRLMASHFLGVLVLLIVPCLLFGAAFPLAAAQFGRLPVGPGRAVGLVYGWNTLGAIAGALLAGYAALPLLGLEKTLYAAAGVHALAGAVVLAARPRAPRVALACAALAATAAAARSAQRWDPELLSGGAYKYAVYTAPGEIEESLRKGDLVYYREGRAATVSVKRLGGTLSLAIDGKVDATSSGDMLTQRLLAHVPLLMHPAPRRVCVIGLGSGVTAGSALSHPVEAVDAVEISREVVEAAALFRGVNRDALSDPRLRTIVGDGRNHLLLGDRRYDVIISEPSNPWMAGVSALFTRDFFAMARSRLAAGGLFCQWAHIYNMAPRDLETVVASFTDAFPEAALFLVNEGDVLLLGSNGPLPAPSPERLAERMAEPAVKPDLAAVEVRSPAGLASLYAVGTPALASWVRDADRHTDDRPVLEFRAPRSIHANTSDENRERIRQAARGSKPPEPFASLGASPGAAALAERALMLERSQSYAWGMEAYREAIGREPRLLPAHEGLVRCALRLGRAGELEDELLGLRDRAPVEARVALALLYNNTDRDKEALEQLEVALEADPRSVRALLLAVEVQEQLGNVDALEGLASETLRLAPGNLEAESYLAAASLARGHVQEAQYRADAVLARDAKAARALEVGAIARAKRGDREGARKIFEALVAAHPDASGYLNNYGVFEMEENNHRAAARLFEQAVEIDPRNASGYLGLREAARALADQTLLQRAETALERLGSAGPRTKRSDH